MSRNLRSASWRLMGVVMMMGGGGVGVAAELSFGLWSLRDCRSPVGDYEETSAAPPSDSVGDTMPLRECVKAGPGTGDRRT
jgi:hypothetical protein